MDLNQDTPIPPDMPAGQNPPTGAIIDYYVNSAPAQDVKLGSPTKANKAEALGEKCGAGPAACGRSWKAPLR